MNDALTLDLLRKNDEMKYRTEEMFYNNPVYRNFQNLPNFYYPRQEFIPREEFKEFQPQFPKEQQFHLPYDPKAYEYYEKKDLFDEKVDFSLMQLGLPLQQEDLQIPRLPQKNLYDFTYKDHCDYKLYYNKKEEKRKSGQLDYLQIEEVLKDVGNWCKDQCGSRSLQAHLDVASEAERHEVFQKLIPHLSSLMVDIFGNYVVQKFFDVGNQEQKAFLCHLAGEDAVRLSQQMYGCRVIQKALECCSLPLQIKLLKNLKDNVIASVENQHANHVIQKCIECLDFENIEFIVNYVTEHVQTMCKHTFGCRVVQRIFEYVAVDNIRPLVEKILENLPRLAKDQFANYVVQNMWLHGDEKIRSRMLDEVCEKILQFSCHKYASNVVEKILEHGNHYERSRVLNAIIGVNPDNPMGEVKNSESWNSPLFDITQDKFGNYVIQRALDITEGRQREALLWRLREKYHILEKVGYGKHIVNRLQKMAVIRKKE